MSDRTPSWKDRLHRAPKASFVGRTVQLQAFRSTLATPLEQRATLLFNISGQGGIGKTTLLKQFRRIAEELKGVAAYVDEGSATNAIDNVPEALSRLALDLEKQGYELKEFQKQYRTYRQKKQELEADPEAPTGLAAGMGKFMTKAGIGVAKSLPGGGLLDVVDADGLADQAGAWTAFVARKLGNKDEVQLVQEPVEVLTPLFLAELNRIAAKQTVVLLLDTYEQTGAFWEDWLLAVLDDRFAELLPANCVLCIAGRDPLDRNRWVEWEPWLVRSELEPFSRVEAEQFLVGQGVTAAAVVEEIWRLSSGGLPVLIGMMAQGAPESVGAVSDACESAVERFLKWETDEAQRTLALRAALPRVLNQDVLAVVQGGEDVERLFGWLKGRSFVVQHPEGWQYHAIVREQMLRYQRRLSLATWERLHGQLAAFYEERRGKLGLEEKAQWQNIVWQRYTLEWLYHSLCEAPQQHLNVALRGWLMLLMPMFNTAQSLEMWRLAMQEWATTIVEAGRIGQCIDLESWGERLGDFFRKFEDEEANDFEIVLLFSEILNSGYLEEQSLKIAHLVRAIEYSMMIPNHFDDALTDFKRAIELDLSWDIPHAALAEFYQAKECHEEAILAYQQAIVLAPEEAHYHEKLGDIYRILKRHKDAEKAYQRASYLNPTWATLHNNLGDLYREQERYEEAIPAYKRATELDPEWAFPHYYIGSIYRCLKRYEEAEDAYRRVADLVPTAAIPYNDLGNLYQDQEQYEEAISAYKRATELDPEWAAPHYYIGNVYRSLKRYEDAEDAYQRASALNPTWATPHNDLGDLYREQERYEEAIAAYQKSIELDPEWAIIPHCNLVILYTQQDHHNNASLTNIQAIKSSFEWVFCHQYKLGNIYSELKRYEDAEKSYHFIAILAPTWASPYNDLGNLYCEQERYQEAISAYQQAIFLDSKWGLPHLNLGGVYRWLKLYKDAENSYNCAIYISPDWATPHNELGNLYQEQERYDEAIVAYQQASIIDPRDKYIFANLGETYGLLERYAEAVEFCNCALTIDENYDWAIFIRGASHLLMKQCDLAIHDFDHAIALNSENGWYFYCRAIAHLALNHPEAANTDIVAAIALAQAKYDEDSTNWQNTCNLALYHLVANDFDKANGLYRSAIAEAPNDLLQEAQRDLQDLLRIFPGHAIAQKMATLLTTAD